MPLYEYRCRACGHVMEVLQKLSDPPKRKCEKCAGRVEKMVSRAAFQLKGGGWYNEGYGKAAAGSKAEGSDKGGAESAAGATEKPSSEKSSEQKGKDSEKKGGKDSEKKSKDGGKKAAAG